jgi:hypothetical protein
MKTLLVNEVASEDCIRAYFEDDIEENLEHARHLRSLPQKNDWGRHIAHIPNIVAMKWLNDEWHHGNTGLRYMSKEWDELVRRKLQDPDWAYLRTDGGTNQSGWRANDRSRTAGV